MPMKQAGEQMATMAMRGCFAHLKSASSEFAKLVREKVTKILPLRLNPEKQPQITLAKVLQIVPEPPNHHKSGNTNH